MTQFDRAGGVPALLKALEPLLDTSAVGVTGKPLTALLDATAPRRTGRPTIGTLDEPIGSAGPLAALKALRHPNARSSRSPQPTGHCWSTPDRPLCSTLPPSDSRTKT